MFKATRVWYVYPSCNSSRARTALHAWRQQGYAVAILLDAGMATVGADLEIYVQHYGGYYHSANRLCRAAVAQGAHVVVVGGDDMEPDPIQSADAIAQQFIARFPDTFGVMQPIGDRLQGTDTICGSPWVGRSFIERGNGGSGPYWPEYGQFYGDEELFRVTTRLGILWQRADLRQRHSHWIRGGGPTMTDYQQRNGKRHWDRDHELFRRRESLGFPGAELAVAGQHAGQ